jgi:hypothetical protein
MAGGVVVGWVAAGIVDAGGVAAGGAEVVGPLEQLEKMKALISSTARGISSFFIDLSPYKFLLSRG